MIWVFPDKLHCFCSTVCTGGSFLKILQKWCNTFLDSLLSPSAHKVLMLKESAKYR